MAGSNPQSPEGIQSTTSTLATSSQYSASTTAATPGFSPFSTPPDSNWNHDASVNAAPLDLDETPVYRSQNQDEDG
jgi:hypothetical protein